MRLIILDRDGVINEDSEEYIKSPAEWHPIPGSIEAIARLHRAGWHVIVLTNQSGIARKLFDLGTLLRIHEKMNRTVAEAGGLVDAVFFCPHGPEDGCECRKPQTGLFHDIASRLRISLHGIPSIGDSLRDLQAARAAGAQPILVKTGKGLTTMQHKDFPVNVPVFEDLAEAVDAVLSS